MKNISEYTVRQSPRVTKQIAKNCKKATIPEDTPYTFKSLKPPNKFTTQVQAEIVDENCFYFATETGQMTAIVTKPLISKSKLSFNVEVETGMGLFELQTGFKSGRADGKPREIKRKLCSNKFNEVFEYVELTKDDFTPYDWDMCVPDGISQLKVRGILTIIYYIDGVPHKLEKVAGNHRVKNHKKFLEEVGAIAHPLDYGLTSVSDYIENLSLGDALRLPGKVKINGQSIAYLTPNYYKSSFVIYMFESKRGQKAFLRKLREKNIKFHYCPEKQFYKANNKEQKIHLHQKPLAGYVVVIEYQDTPNNYLVPGVKDFNTKKKDFTPRELVPAWAAWAHQYGGIPCDKIPAQKPYRTVEGEALSLNSLLTRLKVNRDLRYSSKKHLNTTPRSATFGARGLCENYNRIFKAACSAVRDKNLSPEEIREVVKGISDIFERTNPTQHKMTENSITQMTQRIHRMSKFTRGSIGCCHGSPILELRKKEKRGDTSEFVLLLRRLINRIDIKYRLQT